MQKKYSNIKSAAMQKKYNNVKKYSNVEKVQQYKKVQQCRQSTAMLKSKISVKKC